MGNRFCGWEVQVWEGGRRIKERENQQGSTLAGGRGIFLWQVGWEDEAGSSLLSAGCGSLPFVRLTGLTGPRR